MDSNSRSVSNLGCENSSRGRGTRLRTQSFSVETSSHTVGGAFCRPERLSPNFDQRYTGNASADSPTGAMSITLTESVHRPSHQSLFSDSFIHHQPTAHSPTTIFETIGVSNRYNRDSLHQSDLNNLGIITHMSGVPEKPHFSSPENYGPSYDEDNNTSPNPPTPRLPPQQLAPLTTVFDPGPGNITRDGRPYSVEYLVNPPPPQGAEYYLQQSEWFQDNATEFYGTYSHDNSRQLGPQNIPPRPLSQDLSQPFNEKYRGLDNIPVGLGQPSSSGVRNVEESETGFTSDESQYSPDFPNPDYSSIICTLDPRLYPQPPELSRKASRNSKTKIRTVQRNPRKDTEKTQSPPRSSQRPNHQVGFESVLDTGGNIPGCHVLTPTVMETSNSGDVIGTIVGVVSESGQMERGKAKRKPMDIQEKAAVKQNRLFGVCLRCKIYKEKCRGGFPCLRCNMLPGWRPICVTTQFLDKKVFSRGIYYAIYQRHRDVLKEWHPLSQDISISNGLQPSLRLLVNQYTPNTESSLNLARRCITGSGFTSLKSTPFGVKNEHESMLITHLDQYLDELMPLVLGQLCGPDVDKIYRDTMNCAYQYQRDNIEGGAIVLLALRIWTAQFIFFRGGWRIIPGHESLGMSAITSPDLRLANHIPLPDLLNSQLDYLLEKKIADLELQFLTGLQGLIFRRQPDEWFRIFLAIFVFISSIEEDTWNLGIWKAALGSSEATTLNSTIPWFLSLTPRQYIERNEQLVEILIALFRGVSKGQAPFTLDWSKPEAQETVGKEQAAIRYMSAMTTEVKERMDVMGKRRGVTFASQNPNSLNMKFSSRLIVIS